MSVLQCPVYCFIVHIIHWVGAPGCLHMHTCELVCVSARALVCEREHSRAVMRPRAYSFSLYLSLSHTHTHIHAHTHWVAVRVCVFV
jgi:hypothetical protein